MRRIGLIVAYRPELHDDWSGATSDIIPNFGDYTDVDIATSGDDVRGVFAWTDGRLSDPQPFTAAILLSSWRACTTPPERVGFCAHERRGRTGGDAWGVSGDVHPIIYWS